MTAGLCRSDTRRAVHLTSVCCLATQVRLNAVNDSFILRSCVSWLLKRTFESDSCYLQLVEMFREVRSLPCSSPDSAARTLSCVV